MKLMEREASLVMEVIEGLEDLIEKVRDEDALHEVFLKLVEAHEEIVRIYLRKN